MDLLSFLIMESVGKGMREGMAKNHTMWVKYFLIFILVSLSFTVIPELLKGRHSFSVLEIAGDLLISSVISLSICIHCK